MQQYYMNKSRPFVSVLLPVYNGEDYLAESIQSVLDQTYGNFELIVLDDGSTDRSREIGLQFAELDARVKLVHNSSNHGLVTTLNHGLDIAQGKFIARMDADDICLPARFVKQVEYLESHPEIGVLGCDIHYMDENGNLTVVPDFSFHSDVEIRWNLFFINPFCHPAVMIRKSIIDKYQLRYDSQATHVEDYEFWGRFLLVSNGENLPEILLHYRIHSRSVGSTQGNIQNQLAEQITAEIIENHLPNLNASPQEIKQWISTQLENANIPFYMRSQLMIIYIKLWRAFEQKHKGTPGLANLKKKVISWASVMSLYPLFQPGWVRAVRFLTKAEWRWPLFLLKKLPYFYRMRHHLESIRK